MIIAEKDGQSRKFTTQIWNSMPAHKFGFAETIAAIEPPLETIAAIEPKQKSPQNEGKKQGK